MKKLAFALIALFIPLIILVAATEANLRWIGLGDPLLYYVSPEFGYALQPAQKRKRLRGAFVTINRSGLRSSHEWSEKTDQKILFVGDSVTYGGSYIDDSQLFSELTCTNLAQKAKGKFLCGNAGTNAYGISNMVGRLRYENYSDADVIVVTIGSGDAIRGMTRLGSLPYFRLSPARTGLPGLAEAVAFVLDRVRGKLRFGAIGPESSDISDERKARFARDSINTLVIELRRLQTDGKSVLLFHSPAQVHVEEHCCPVN